jgi:hypothetical protein
MTISVWGVGGVSASAGEYASSEAFRKTERLDGYIKIGLV